MLGPALILVFILPLNIRFPSAADSALTRPGFGQIRRRLATDQSLLSAAATLGWTLLVIFAGTQGVRHVRTRTELDLAEKLQQTLAPPLSIRNARYDIHGRSVPSSQMGGDLLDAVSHDGSLSCYVGDVAGHGIQAGVFMGMVKSSARTVLLRPGRLEGLLADLNQVLLEVKAGSATYVTFACLRCLDGGTIEYSLAGHGPILHYHGQSKTVSQLSMEQFPVGLFAGATFESGIVEVEPGDILALLTDGIPEVADRNDEQFGLERIGDLIAQNAAVDLAVLAEKLFAAVRRHGSQNDDETLLLVRAHSPRQDQRASLKN